MNAAQKYFAEVTDRWGTNWNRFWFTPIDVSIVGGMRILTGLMALWYLLSWSTQLMDWFGPHGLLSLDAVRQLTAQENGEWNGRASVLYFLDEPALLVTVHVLGLLIVAAFTAGIASRITSVLSLAVVLSYVHRAPMITGQFEPVLTFMLFYLCFAPSGGAWSVDRWLARRKQSAVGTAFSAKPAARSTAANVGLRLMQVHVAALYLIMGLTKLGGSDTWWAGEAMWWLAAHSESRLVDLTFLYNWQYLINLWTLAVVMFEVAFGLLIWNRLARPLLLAIAVVHWILIGLVTGLLSFCAMMLVANLVFVPADMWPHEKTSAAD